MGHHGGCGRDLRPGDLREAHGGLRGRQAEEPEVRRARGRGRRSNRCGIRRGGSGAEEGED
eukprot:2440903-Alexandrium_andersonii.AAC.1